MHSKTTRMKSFSIEEFTAACHASAARLRADLPGEHTADLRQSRRAQRHGTEQRFFQFFFWLKGQAGSLDKNHFNCSVIYDGPCRYHGEWRDRGLPHQLFCRFYANKIRIYNHTEYLQDYLRRELRAAEKRLPGWFFDEHEQMLSLMHPFEADSVASLEESVYLAMKRFLPLWVPHYRHVCGVYTSGLDPEAVRAFKRERGHAGYVPKRSKGDLTRYARAIPARFRSAVLARDKHRCRQCGSTDDLHIDHILPVSRGGLTVLDNLQTLCAPCNLRKGNRTDG